MPGRIHEHNGIRVYHRKDGALIFHNRRHSRYSLGRDIRQHSNKRPSKQGYPQSGDGRPQHIGTNEPIHRKKGRKKGRKGRKRGR